MRLLWPAILLALVCPVRADVVILIDGTRLEGDLRRTSDGWTITMPDGKLRTVAADSVKSVQLGSSAVRGSAQTADALASLRRSVEALSDINQIIERYQRFIDGAKDQAVLADARADLTLWQQRQTQGLVKYGGKWIAPGEIDQLVAQATSQAIEARDLIRENRNHDADVLLQQAIADDPANAAAHYLRGVILFRQDKLADARKEFESVNAAVPQHPPTLNNLAVILWKQNQFAGALTFYDQSMQAAGINDYILNNVAEALGSMSDDQRKGTAYTRVMKRFAEQDQILQKQMSQRGLYRWGAGWVDEKKLDELKTAEKDIRTRLDAFQLEFEQSKTRMEVIDTEIVSNQQAMDQLRLNHGYRDGMGNWVVLPPPPAYYDLDQRNRQLASEQQSLKIKLTQLQDQAKRAQQQIPIPQFTGIQQLVGVEGMPAMAGAKPATLPAVTR